MPVLRSKHSAENEKHLEYTDMYFSYCYLFCVAFPSGLSVHATNSTVCYIIMETIDRRIVC